MRNPEYKPGDVMWRAPGVAVRYTPADRFVHDRKDGKKFRGAQVRAVDADTLTLGVRLESNLNGERTVARSLAPRAILGDGLVCEVTGNGGEDYTVVALHDGIPTTNGRQAESVAAGLFNPGAIPPAFY